MRKTSITIAAAIAVLGSTVAMAREAPTRFVRDGVTYEYTAEQHGAHQVLIGRSLPSGEPFRLVVTNGHVHGLVSGVQVAFNVADIGPTNTQIASR
ncbi:hypothetical protein [uncultured Sphingomonas sp.]|uniref:hypothetical protein n=1 Tax=uncultured Sphingomonas sp. TaxID=158754 RepID=UPI0035CBE8AB